MSASAGAIGAFWRNAFAGRLQTFDLVVANPMWNQKFPQELYENDPYDRFRYGTPPSSSADWGWLRIEVKLHEADRLSVKQMCVSIVAELLNIYRHITKQRLVWHKNQLP
ncbi:MAG: N-6 DNA methylase [Thermoguttaceae bacterium]|nr:N-6 DNA methylase [Thermoguttaceae bacterium]